MWLVEGAVQLGRTGEILVNLRGAPSDIGALTLTLMTAFIFESLEFATDTDDQGVTTEWAVLRNARSRSPETAGVRSAGGTE
jgi:hypothetical protein